MQMYVPGGEFIMGVDDPEAPRADEQRPPHPVKLSPFWMDKYEVTNEQFVRFLNQLLAEGGKQWTDRQCYETVYSRVLIEHPLCGLEFDLKHRHVTVKEGKQKFPAMPVPWGTAVEYAAKMGRRLPTEAEWEFAARGTDGRRYPWGNDWNPRYANVHSGKPCGCGRFSWRRQPVRDRRLGRQRAGMGPRRVRRKFLRFLAQGKPAEQRRRWLASPAGRQLHVHRVGRPRHQPLSRHRSPTISRRQPPASAPWRAAALNK